MKKLLLSILLLSLFHAAAPPRQRAARLFDSFGNIPRSDLMARLDGFAIELQNNPDSKGYIVVYPVTNKFPGATLRRASSSLGYMVHTRGLDASRISVVDGGLRNEVTYELWLVPPGADLPVKPFDPTLMMVGTKTPVLFDSFPIIERGDPEEKLYEDSDEFYPDARGLYDIFADLLRRDPSLRGCIIAYARPRRRGTDRQIAARAKLALARSNAVDLSRVVAVGGGLRKEKMVDLWLVPPGAELPKPTPTIRTRHRRRR
jgi:hypothetical protein